MKLINNYVELKALLAEADNDAPWCWQVMSLFTQEKGVWERCYGYSLGGLEAIAFAESGIYHVSNILSDIPHWVFFVIPHSKGQVQLAKFQHYVNDANWAEHLSTHCEINALFGQKFNDPKRRAEIFINDRQRVSLFNLLLNEVIQKRLEKNLSTPPIYSPSLNFSSGAPTPSMPQSPKNSKL